MSAEAWARIEPHAFDLRPERSVARDAAVLCLHGLTGTPYEVRPVAEALVARGLRARGPWMAGHEGGHEVLARTSCADWVELAEAELVRLRSEHARVFLVGVSMGGLVALRLAQTAAVDGLVVVGVPLALPRPLRLLARLLRPVLPYRAKQGSDICEPVARARHPGLAAMPLAAVVELTRLQALVASHLGRVRAPILVAHGRRDRTAAPADAARIHAGVESADRELYYLERSGHVATVDYDGRALARAAADFLARRC
ncbi:MAG: alpha/beta fold hydrolase [Myxococcota bacterium]